MQHITTLNRCFSALLLLVSVSCWPGQAKAQTPSMLDPVTTQVAAGRYHTCALTSTGGVKCWGRNAYGQLGDSSHTNSATPVNVTGLASGVVAIAAGGLHTCALTSTGGLQCWGYNENGQLGNNSTTSSATPVDVAGLANAVVAIAAGSSHTCALTTAGAVKCWGANSYGQLGDNSTANSNAPVDVTGLASGAVMIAAGAFHSCALTTDGGVKCWGANNYGQLGDNSTANSNKPVVVTGLASGAMAIAAGAFHSCALTTTGGAKCWGANDFGQLGNNSTVNSDMPVDVTGLASGVAAMAAGELHTCALTAVGGVKCWGHNANGQLGDGSATDRHVPVTVTGLASGVVAIDAGFYHSCALTAAGGMKCSGRNDNGQLGDNSTTNRHTPVNVTGLDSGIAAIAAGGDHSCALTSTGGVKCWGWNRFGQLGDNSSTDRHTPVDVTGLASGMVAVAAGVAHTCALTTTGGVKCWGFNAFGQLGNDSTISRDAPVDVTGLASGVVAIAAGLYHTCALTTVGGVKCWGDNDEGQLGDNSTTERHTPVDVTGLASGVVAIAVGDDHNCALTMAGGVKCWGDNSYGQLGDSSNTGRLTPVDVIGLASGVVAVAAGELHTCAVTTTGGVKCWGDNTYGQLGDNSTTGSVTPVDTTGLASGVTTIAAGESHTCVLTTSGRMQCWGHGSFGELGVGTTIEQHVPVSILTGQGIVFAPPQRLGWGHVIPLQATATGGGTVSFDTWTPAVCSLSGSMLTLEAPGLCGVRASQVGGSDAAGGTLAAAPQELRVIYVDADLIFSNGFDLAGGLSR